MVETRSRADMSRSDRSTEGIMVRERAAGRVKLSNKKSLVCERGTNVFVGVKGDDGGRHGSVC